MPKTVGPIKFNCRQRLRKHRGVERNFDAAAMAAIVNSPAVQERVANGDMLGYYGHLPRVVFGMEPGECQIHPTTGKMVILEPAIATTRLSAAMDGTITHEVKFLDTEAGKRAAAVHASGAGGFSSAISCVIKAGQSVPQSFHGFDFVHEPNFSGNRGYCLDGIMDGPSDEPTLLPGATFDSATGAISPVTMALIAQFDSATSALHAQLEGYAAQLSRVMSENEELLSILSKRPEEVQRMVSARLAALDTAGYVRPEPPQFFADRVTASQSSLGRMAAAFDSAKLDEREGEPAPIDPAAQAIARAMRGGRAMLRNMRLRSGL